MTRRSPWLPRLLTLFVAFTVAIPAAPAQEPAVDEAPGYLGVIADDQQTGGRGVRILKVLPGSPAEAGGLQVADLVTSINGKQVRGIQDVGEVITGSHVGDSLQFEVIRNDRPESATVVLGRRPAPGERRFPQFGQIPQGQPADSEAARGGPQLWLGVRAVNVTSDVQRRLNRPGLSGAVVTEVADDSPASEAGLAAGAVIVALDGERISDSRDLIYAVRAATPNEAHTIEFYQPSGERVQNSVLLRFKGTPPVADTTPNELPPEGTPLPEPDGLVLPPPAEDPLAENPIEALQQRVARLETQLTEIERLLRTLVAEENAKPPADEPDELPAP